MNKYDVIEQAGNIATEYANRKNAKLTPISKSNYPVHIGNGRIVLGSLELGKFEGCGFNPSFQCPDIDCIYYKWGTTRPHCCHPKVDTHLEIGGISRCWGIANSNKKVLSFWNKIKNLFCD